VLYQDSKQRLKAMQKSSQPITATAYNHDGTIFAYSVSYDWSRGHAEHNPAAAKNYILLHSPSENEVQVHASCGARHFHALYSSDSAVGHLAR
jgi:mRNA export factor